MGSAAIVVEGLTKVYPRITAVDGISFEVAGGEIFGFLGPNGAGKTTTIRLLLTLIKPSSGKISLFGNGRPGPPGPRPCTAGYVPQDVSVDGDLSGYENMLMYAKLYGTPACGTGRAISLKPWNTWKSRTAPGKWSAPIPGDDAAPEIAQALINRPKILFLDEPSIGLDPSARAPSGA